MLAQTGEHGLLKSQSSSVVSLFRNILQKEGIVGLWAGNGANLLRVFPAKAVVFASNDSYRHLIGTYVLGKSSNTIELNGGFSFLAGGLSGMTASAVTYPLDLIRGRITGKLTKNKAYSGILRTLVLTVRDEGFLALYKGMTPTLLGAMPYEGIKFGTVGLLEKYFSSNENGESNSTPLRKMMFGGMGGVMAGLITYPNDTVRRLLQLQGSRGTQVQFDGYWYV